MVVRELYKTTIKCVFVLLMLIILSSVYLYIEICKVQERVEKLEGMPQTEVIEVEVEKNVYEYAEQLYGVEKELLEAIERLETGHYTSELYKEQFNTWGRMINGEPATFESHEQSTMELARHLKFNYFDKGYDTIEKISIKYCPSNHEEWAMIVTELYNQLK